MIEAVVRATTLRRPWLVVVIVCVTVAAWMGLGTLHQYHHADSLLTVLISTQRWTPFFWGQDRFGMLVPLVASPIHHPLANLLVQGWLMTSAALIAPFVMARFLVGRSGPWAAIGAGANTLMLLVAVPAVQFDWLVTQPYGLSIALGFAALTVAAERDGMRSIAAAVALASLASWVNLGIGLMLAIAAAVASARPIRPLTVAAAGTVVASLAARFAAADHTTTALAAPGQWFDGWRLLLEGLSGVTASSGTVVAIALLTVAAVAWLWKTGGMPWRSTTAIVVMAVSTWLVLGTSLWVGMNRYVFRYMYPVLMLTGVGVSTILAAVFGRHIRALSLAALSVLCVLAAVAYGTPSLGRVSLDVDRRFGATTSAVLESGANVIGGDYWRVWPAVFHANLALARRHAHRRVFGLAMRSQETDRLWNHSGGEAVIAAWPDDPSFADVAAEHGVTVTLRVHRPEIDLYAGHPQN